MMGCCWVLTKVDRLSLAAMTALMMAQLTWTKLEGDKLDIRRQGALLHDGLLLTLGGFEGALLLLGELEVEAVGHSVSVGLLDGLSTLRWSTRRCMDGLGVLLGEFEG
jgi:hypothetical protein